MQGNGRHVAGSSSQQTNGQQTSREVPLGRGQIAQLAIGRGLPRLPSSGATKVRLFTRIDGLCLEIKIIIKIIVNI